MSRRFLLVLVAGLAVPRFAAAQEDTKQLAAQVRTIIETNCFRCHGKDGSAEGGFDYILDVPKMIERKKVVPKNLEKSKLHIRIAADKDMPPEGEKPRPSSADVAVLEKWIQAGAPEFESPPTSKKRVEAKFITEVDTYKVIYDYLFARPRDARYLRFITLTHLHNNPRYSDAELRLYRAGISKLLNSLSWKQKLFLPVAIDPQQCVLCIDLRDLDWDLNDGWTKLISHTSDEPKDQFYPGYPYALKHDKYPEDESLNQLATEVYKLTGTEVPVVRADWFLAAAALPPLYHDLLNIPDTLRELEKRLHFDIGANYRRDRLARAGFTKSGVSATANRLIERHEASYGYFWISYDFRSGDGTGNLTTFPLGPLNLFPQKLHPFPNQSFVHDGGEVIWRLPNGSQAYMLLDGKGNRISEGPADVVRDVGETAGRSTLIVNGFSCMGCHKHGMFPDTPYDSIRGGNGLQGSALEKVKRLYPERKVMDQLLKDDETIFLETLTKVIGPFVRVGADKDKDIKLFREPITLLGTPFLKGNVTLEEAALELGLADPKELSIAIKNNPRLQELGLKPWTNGDLVKREVWQSVRGLTSTFQETAAELKRGTPVRTRR